MTGPGLHQMLAGAARGDAITDHALLIQRWLREAGWRSEVYAEALAENIRDRVRPASAYQPAAGEDWLILHHSIGAAIVDQVAAGGQRLIMIYHNVTPPEFFEAVDAGLARLMARGREQLAVLRPVTALALAVSPYNERDLRAAGFERTGRLPIALDERGYAFPAQPALRAGPGPALLFVGRLAPNKKQADLLRLLDAYRRLRPDATLTLVGLPWMAEYRIWLEDVAASLGLGAAVRFTGAVSQAELAGHYRGADLYVSMSEHEGFGKPLIESLHLGLPVLAYASTGVPGTLGGAGVLFHHKDFEALAEVVDVLVTDQALRARLIARGRARAQVFLEPAVRAQWQAHLAGLGLRPGAAAPRPAEAAP